MEIETRPNLRGLDSDQRRIALAHWYLWCEWQVSPGWLEPKAVLDDLERKMQPETAHRIAQAEGSFWREVRDSPAMPAHD